MPKMCCKHDVGYGIYVGSCFGTQVTQKNLVENLGALAENTLRCMN